MIDSRPPLSGLRRSEGPVGRVGPAGLQITPQIYLFAKHLLVAKGMTSKQIDVGFKNWLRDNAQIKRGVPADPETMAALARDYLRKNKPAPNGNQSWQRASEQKMTPAQKKLAAMLKREGVDIEQEFEPAEQIADAYETDADGKPMNKFDIFEHMEPAALALELWKAAESASPGTATALVLAADQLSDIGHLGTPLLVRKLSDRAHTSQEKEICLHGIKHVRPKELDAESYATLEKLEEEADNLELLAELQEVRRNRQPDDKRVLLKEMFADNAGDVETPPPTATTQAPVMATPRTPQTDHKNNPFYMDVAMAPKPPSFANKRDEEDEENQGKPRRSW